MLLMCRRKKSSFREKKIFFEIFGKHKRLIVSYNINGLNPSCMCWQEGEWTEFLPIIKVNAIGYRSPVDRSAVTYNIEKTR